MDHPDLPIGFAHRGGASRRAEQNTVAAFTAAIQHGANGVESDVTLTADGAVVLVHPGLLTRVRRPIARSPRSALPPSVPSLEDLYRACGRSVHVALDMTAPAAVDRVVAAARAGGDPARLWLTYWRVDTLASWRRAFPDVRLVYPTLVVRRTGMRRMVRRLREAGVDALNLHHRAIGRRIVGEAHDGGLLVFAWGSRRGGTAARALHAGVDGVFCDDVPGMVRAVDAERARRARLSAPAGS